MKKKNSEDGAVMREKKTGEILTAPNLITLVRIVGAVILIFIEPMCPAFFVIYTLCGVSDAIDGFVARHTGTVSNFGAMLDSVADILFYAVMLLKVFPILREILPVWVWYCLGLVLAVRIAAYVIAGVKYHRFASLHTYLNKFTGFMVFAIPYFLKTRFAVYFCVSACAVGFISSLEEMVLHICRREYDPDSETVFKK